MNKTLILLATASALMLGACTQTATDLPPGKYETSSTSTDANGTKYSTDRTTKVTEDDNGTKSATVQTEKSTDPKGLFNKSTTKTKSTSTSSGY